MAATTESINVPQMQTFIGTKIIKAKPMTRENTEALLCRDVGGSKNGDGYLVEYEDGYQSWSPKAAFEAAYRLTGAMPFGLAVEVMKKGLKVARTGWNGKGMFLYHVPANSYPAQTDAARSVFGDMVPYGAYVAMKTAQHNVVPWLASQTDVLANDWHIVE